MKQLLQTEWLKIRKYKPFFIIVAFFILGFVAANYLTFSFLKDIKGDSKPAVSINVQADNDTTYSIAESDLQADTTSSSDDFDEPPSSDPMMEIAKQSFLKNFDPFGKNSIWQTVGYASGCVLLLPALLILLLVTNEYNFKTHRQNIIDGWSRQQSVLAKFIWVVLIAIFSTIIMFIVGSIISFIYNKSMSFTNFKYVGYFFLKALTYNCFALFLGALVRKQGFAMAIFFIYVVFENIISQVFKSYSVTWSQSLNSKIGDLGNYLPLNASDGLIPFPDNPLDFAMKDKLPVDIWQITLALAVFYLVLFVWLSYRRLAKSDL